MGSLDEYNKKLKENAKLRKIEYNKNPHLCKYCGKPILMNENDKYNDADVTKEVVFNAKWDLPSPIMELEADAMHEDVVTELSKRLVDGTLVFGNIKQQTAQRINIILRQLYDIKTDNERKLMLKKLLLHKIDLHID